MVEQFPIVLRGYDKDRVDEAFASAQETVNRLREQVKADDQTILELQAQLQEEKNRVRGASAACLARRSIPPSPRRTPRSTR